MADDRTAPHPTPAQATITSGMVALFEAIHPQLNALHKSVVLHAARHPTGPVPAGLVADAGALLAATRRLISRQPLWRGRLTLSPSPGWAELDARLRLAFAACQAFKQLHFYYDRRDGDYAWRLVPTRHPRRHHRRSLPRRALLLLERNLTDLETRLT